MNISEREDNESKHQVELPVTASIMKLAKQLVLDAKLEGYKEGFNVGRNNALKEHSAQPLPPAAQSVIDAARKLQNWGDDSPVGPEFGQVVREVRDATYAFDDAQSQKPEPPLHEAHVREVTVFTNSDQEELERAKREVADLKEIRTRLQFSNKAQSEELRVYALEIERLKCEVAETVSLIAQMHNTACIMKGIALKHGIQVS